MSAYDDLILGTPDLISYWRMGDGSTSITDEMGIASPTTIADGTFGVPGLIDADSDTAVQFAGGGFGTGASVGNPADYQIGIGSMSFWVETTDTGVYSGLVSKEHAFDVRLYVGYLIVYDETHGLRNTNVLLNDGGRHHVIVAFEDGDTVEVYVDGVQVASWDFGVLNQTQPLQIGAASYNVGHVGTLDEVALFGRKLTADEVFVQYHIGTSEAAGAAASADALVNLAVSSVAIAPDPADSGIYLKLTDDIFPPAPFELTISPDGERPLLSNSEIVLVKAYSGGNCIVERAQGGTSARSILVGDAAEQSVTARLFEQHAATFLGGEDQPQWELVWDTGVQGAGNKVLGTNRFTTAAGDTFEDLYWVDGNPDSPNYGLWRLRAGQWENLGAAGFTGVISPNNIFGWGIATYKGDLYVSETTGHLHRLDINAAGVLTGVTQCNDINCEDSFVGPVFNGKLWVGLHNPGGLVSWDGTNYDLVFDGTAVFDGLTGGDSMVANFAVWRGMLWFTVAIGVAGTPLTWLCCMDTDENITVAWQGTDVTAFGFPLAVWRDELVASIYHPSGPTGEISSWNGNGWTPFQTNDNGAGALFPIGDALLLTDYYSGLVIWRDGEALSFDLPPDSGLGFADARIHGGYLYVTTAQNAMLWRLKLGADHAFRHSAARVQQLGGHQALPVVDVITGPKTITPVSGTAFQLTGAREQRLSVPVTFNSSGGDATFVAEISPNDIDYYPRVNEKRPSGGIDGQEETIEFTVPQAWYAKITVTNATIDEGSYF